MDLKLAGKNALVTGSSRGIGLATSALIRHDMEMLARTI